MSKLRFIYLFASIILTTVSCQEEKLKTYSGENYIHFSYMKDRTPQKVEFNFASDAPLSLEGEVGVEMSLWGFLLEKDAPVTVSTVESATNAVRGLDYDLPNNAVFRAGVPKDIYKIPVKRNKELLKTDLKITLHLDKVGNCSCAPEEYLVAKIHVTDKVSEPKWWKQSIASKLGPYSDIKYRLFIIFMGGKILKNLDEYSGIQFAKLISDFKAWWKEEWVKGNYRYYCEDGKTALYETIG